MARSRSLVLGLGNSLMSDDAIGLRIVNKLSEQNSFYPRLANFEFKTSEKVGLNLIELLEGYEQAIIIDAIITHTHPPGEIIEFSLEALPENPRLRCPHDVDFRFAVELARKTGYRMPKHIFIWGIEVIDTITFADKLSEEISSLFPKILEKIIIRLETLENQRELRD